MTDSTTGPSPAAPSPAAQQPAPQPPVANPYVAQPGYVAPVYAAPPAYSPQPPYVHAEQPPYAAAAPVNAGQPYAPNPTAPAPYPVAPYTVGGQAYAYTTPRTNPLALTAMILSLVSIIAWLPAIGGVICGHIALAQIKRTGEAGRGMAITGIAVGYAIIAFTILYIVGMIALFTATANF